MQLPDANLIIAPWGVAHMPGIADEIQKLGFRLNETREYQVIGFRPPRNKPPAMERGN